MKILLDENFPLPLYHRLKAAGHDVENFLVRRPTGKLFDLLETGELIPWEVHESGD